MIYGTIHSKDSVTACHKNAQPLSTLTTQNTEHSQTEKWESERNRELGRLKQWKTWGTNKSHKIRCQQDKQYKRKGIRQSDRPTKKRKPGAASWKRGRQTQAPMDGPHSTFLHSLQQRNRVWRQSPFHACHTHTPCNHSGRKNIYHQQQLTKLSFYFFAHACQQTRHSYCVPTHTS